MTEIQENINLHTVPAVTSLVPSLRRAGQILSRGCLGFIAFYGLTSTVIIVAWLIVGERFRTISMLVSFLALLLLPALIFLPLLLILRRWRRSLLVVAPFAMFIISYGVMFLPRSVTIPPDALQLRLMTYNLHAERNIFAPMLDIIRESGADIVAVQEMSTPMEPQLNDNLADVYPYRATYPEPEGGAYHGRGILSKYPILDNRIWPVQYPLPVRLQRVVVDVQGTPVTIYNFHAPPSQPIYGRGINFAPRARQVQDVLDMIAQDSGPVLLMCDCNTYDLDQNYRRITADLSDTYREIGWGMGFTNPDWSTEQGREGPAFIPPHQRPDYIFHNEYFLPVESYVWPDSGGSDHRPVYAVLALKPANGK